MLPVAEAALVPLSAPVKVTKLPLALLIADELSARVAASGPEAGGVLFVVLPPQPVKRADIPTISSSATHGIRLRRPGSPIRKIAASPAVAPARMITLAGLLCVVPVEEGAAV